MWEDPSSEAFHGINLNKNRRGFVKNQSIVLKWLFVDSQALVSPGDRRKSQNRIFGSVSSTTLPWPCVFSDVSADWIDLPDPLDAPESIDFESSLVDVQ